MSGGATLDVSRETIERLKTYEALLRKWTQKINLVARSTLDDLWARHFVDSAQIYRLAPHPVGHWADLGSGGGFPGLVIAIMAMEHQSPARVTLVESDSRKCAFLRTVISRNRRARNGLECPDRGNPAARSRCDLGPCADRS